MRTVPISLPSEHAVDSELRRVFDQKIAAAEPYGTWFSFLWTSTGSRVTGGKQVRPRMFLAALDALAEATPPSQRTRRSAVHLAAAIELLHFSFLLHDDVIDGDLMRRGAPNLITELAQAASTPERLDERLHWARSCAILMGDLLLAEVHQIFARVDVSNEQRAKLLNLLQHTITESVAGEQADVGLSDGIVSAELSRVLDMCALKTATYTFEFPLRAAAILAVEHSEPLEQVLAQLGRHLGLAFQLQDDLLSTFGDPDAHGKDAFSDLREGKETAIIAYARMNPVWASIEPDFGNPNLTRAQAEVLRERLAHAGAESFVLSLIDDQLRAMHELIAQHSSLIPAALSQIIVGFAAELEGRHA